MNVSPVTGPTLLALPGGLEPRLPAGTFVAQGATVVGNVHAGERVSVWYGATLRADCGGHEIVIGERSNVQDNASVHVGLEHPVRVGAGVSIGHNAVLHGCEIEDDVLVGMGAVVLNGARIGRGSLIAAGAVVLEGTEIPERSLVAGVPGKVRRQTTDDEVAAIRRNADVYLELSRAHSAARPV
ncbi:gamma carbonic anhydrase family protein [Georgenia subflava]|uniref:Gamma carbonic anhydrase family protein n=1 Tax=Georgenia subflava TaxID=1622177 RepID=A0A6N7EH72_9MICO|nr:gamma carbonic anhydrase family protein [Georgenia subflava]MPV35496.1 gamma carbonic anhydrase family protein [Georgenia subflava]